MSHDGEKPAADTLTEDLRLIQEVDRHLNGPRAPAPPPPNALPPVIRIPSRIGIERLANGWVVHTDLGAFACLTEGEVVERVRVALRD